MTSEKSKWTQSIDNIKGLLDLALPMEEIVHSLVSPSYLKLILDLFQPQDLVFWAILDTPDNSNLVKYFVDFNRGLFDDEVDLEAFKRGLLRSQLKIYRILDLEGDRLGLEEVPSGVKSQAYFSSQDFFPKKGGLFVGRVAQGQEAGYLVHGTPCLNMSKEAFLAQFKASFRDQFGSFDPQVFSRPMVKEFGREFMMVTAQARRDLLSSGLSVIQGGQAPGSDEVLYDHDFDLEEADPNARILYFIEEEVLGGEDQALEDMGPEDLDRVLVQTAREGGFVSDDQLLDFINFLVERLAGAGPKIQSRIVYYKSLLQASYKGFYIDRGIKKIIESDQGLAQADHLFLYGFERYMEEALHGEGIKLTGKGRMTSSSIQVLADGLGLKPIKRVKRPDQRHFPAIHLWQSFARLKGLVRETSPGSKDLEAQSKYTYYLNLSVAQRLGLWLSTIFHPAFGRLAFEEEEGAFFALDYDDLMARLGKIYRNLEDRGPINKKTLDLYLGFDFDYFRQIMEGLAMIEGQDREGDLVYQLTPLGLKLGSYYGLRKDRPQAKVLDFPS